MENTGRERRSSVTRWPSSRNYQRIWEVVKAKYVTFTFAELAFIIQAYFQVAYIDTEGTRIKTSVFLCFP